MCRCFDTACEVVDGVFLKLCILVFDSSQVYGDSFHRE